MIRNRPSRALLACALLCSLASCPGRGFAATPLKTVRVAQGLTFPLYVTAPPGDTTRLFVLERRGSDDHGRIKIVKSGTVLSTPFLTTPRSATGNEQGLLGLAFAPDYATSGRFYVNFIDSLGNTVISRYTVSANPDIANPAGTIVFSLVQPFENHNGGWLGFGPDGFLYLALGDGGGQGDPGDRAQDIHTFFGKILRLDVSGAAYTIPPGNPFAGPTDGLDEIWSFALRNPWRCSFDRETGDFVIADVGQNLWEEIDFAPAGNGGGQNYGWRCYEGSHPFDTSTTTPCDSCTNPSCPFVMPAYEYDHSLGRCSITGGYIYRGCAIPDLKGTYFFGDWCAGRIYSGKFQAGVLTGVLDRTTELAPGGGLAISNIPSFGEDARGELYICDSADGEVYKVVPAAPVLEQDMPVLLRRTALGDSIGETGKGNALLPGITPFIDPGSRIRGVGYLKDASIRDCGSTGAGSMTTRLRLDPFDIDVETAADSVNSLLTRRLIFTNRAGSARALAFTDVIAPSLGGNLNGATTASNATPSGSAVLVQYNSFSPSRWVVHSGKGSAGVTYSADVDTASQIESRVAADQPLAGGRSAGPAPVALALGFDFGLVSPAVPETVTVTTKVQATPPTGIDTSSSAPSRAELRILGATPLRAPVRLELALPHSGPIALEVFDVLGRKIRTLARGTSGPGVIRLAWDGRSANGREAATGIYWLRLRTDRESIVQKAVLFR
jgi:glucose/arabinose dehydrogenase